MILLAISKKEGPRTFSLPLFPHQKKKKMKRKTHRPKGSSLRSLKGNKQLHVLYFMKYIVNFFITGLLSFPEVFILCKEV